MSMCIFLCVIIFKCIGENMYGCPSLRQADACASLGLALSNIGLVDQLSSSDTTRFRNKTEPPTP